MKKIPSYCLLFIICLILFNCENKKPGYEGKTVVRFWHAMGGPLGAVLNKMINEFNTEHPQYFIKSENMGSYNALSQKLLASIIAKNQPDIAQCYESWIMKFLEGDLLVPFDNFIENIDEFKKDLFPIFLQNSLYNGKLFSLPFNKSVPVMYYNKDMFEKVGLNPNKPPTSWEEFIKYGKILTQDLNHDGKPDIWANIAKLNVTDFECLLYQNNGRLTDENETHVMFNSPEGIEALAFLVELKYIHNIADYYIGGVGFQHQTDFEAKRAAMIFSSCVSRVWMQRNITFNIGMAKLLKNKKTGVLVYGTNIVLFSRSSLSVQRAAWEFINWFLSTENTARWAVETGYIPVRRSSIKTEIMKKALKEIPDLRVTFEQLESGFLDPRASAWYLARQYLSKAIDNVFLSDKIKKAYQIYIKEGTAKEQYFKEVIREECKRELDRAAKLSDRWFIK